MKATYTITFKGFSDKAAQALDKMLRADIATFPARLRMESVSIKPSEYTPKDHEEKTVSDEDSVRPHESVVEHG